VTKERRGRKKRKEVSRGQTEKKFYINKNTFGNQSDHFVSRTFRGPERGMGLGGLMGGG